MYRPGRTTPQGPCPPTRSRLIVKRGEAEITATVPLPVVVVDSLERQPYTFDSHRNWVGEVVRERLPTGDYTVRGMETLLTLERKSLEDLLVTLMHQRERFLRECERMAGFRHRAILIEASYEDCKTPYNQAGLRSSAHPNGVCGTLDAIEARYGIPIIYTARSRALAEEKAASWLSKHFTYFHLEANGLGRVLQDGDL